MPHILAKLTVQVLRNNVDYFNVGTRAGSTFWGNVPMGPPDVILGISEAYKRDTDPKKVNLGVGAYRDDDGKPYVLPSVRKAEEIIFNKCMNHEYAPISGDPTYTKAVAKLAFGEDSESLKSKSNCTVQTLSGTGALRLGLEFAMNHYGGTKEIWFPNPTWGNHPQICNLLRMPHKKYRYYDPKTHGFDLNGACEDIKKMPSGSIILLHACAHNPTGVDPKKEDWKVLSKVIKEQNVLPFFDMAYQGFATGSVDNDAYAVRLFEKESHTLMLAQSFAKNMGLYGERIGALTIMCCDEESAAKVMSQVKILIRTIYSNPAICGSRIVTEILTNPELNQMWLRDVKAMADRIITMRKELRERIEKRGNKLQWNHITDQIGMFCFTGLTPDQILVALHFYARGSYQGSVGQNDDAPMAQQTVSRCIREVSFAINTPEILRKYIKFPQNANERNIIRRKFHGKYNLPGVIGCIDCTHVAIVRPCEHEERFFNRKHFHSINTQVVARLTKEFHIYLTKDGRISVAGISSKNVDYVAEAIHKVTS